MTFVAGIDLTPWFRENVTDTLVFSTAATSAKPVHVLNGFLAKCLEGPRAPKLASALIARNSNSWVTAEKPLRQLLAQAPQSFKVPSNSADLDKVRHLLRALLAGDRAVFATMQSYQVAHPAFITNDPTGGAMGLLCASLLLNYASGTDELLALVERLCETQPNPYWVLQSALAGPVDSNSFSISEVRPVPWATNDVTKQLANNLGNMLRRAVQLGSVAADSLDALKVLANAIEFACVLSYAQVPSLLVVGDFTPLLAVVSSDADTVLDSSARGSLPLMHSAMDNWIASKLQRTVRERLGDAVQDKSASEAFLLQTVPFSAGAKEKRLERSRLLVEKTPEALEHLIPKDDPTHAPQDLSGPVALVLLDLLKTTMAQSYAQWFDHHARHCGFLAPRRGNTSKRFCIEANLVTTLVLAVLEEQESEVSFDEFLNRLETRFGIAVGPTAQTRSMAPRASESELESNRDALAHLLTRLGLARAYSDNTTEVLNPLQMWNIR
ncbi:hypothetical protein [Streptomyces avicenniae]|uniref:hypothetical protein n=1 Tax=Streptomyces avicenniae TaxID=500153 RepID=UPI00167D4795|nr:hypothetical protein [Streptomyces avicenniae]